MDTLLEEIKPVVTQKIEFEDQDKTKNFINAHNHQHTDPSNEMTSSAMDCYLTRYEFLIEISTEDIELVSTGE